MRFATLRRLLRLGPLFFAASFLTPLAAQIIIAAGVTPPFGLSPLLSGLIIAMAAGTLAYYRGRWI